MNVAAAHEDQSDDDAVRVPRQRAGQFALAAVALFIALLGARWLGDLRADVPANDQRTAEVHTVPAAPPAIAQTEAPPPSPAAAPAPVRARDSAAQRPRATRPLRDVVWSDRQQALVPIDATGTL
jgi:hypothetical protein